MIDRSFNLPYFRELLRSGKRHRSGGYINVSPGKGKGGYFREHVLIAEVAIGHRLPDGAEVHHFDAVRSHNANTNLVVCEDRAYHMLLHSRQRISDAGYDPNDYKICSLCQTAKPRSEFHSDTDRYDKKEGRCKPCLLTNQAAGYARRQSEKLK